MWVPVWPVWPDLTIFHHFVATITTGYNNAAVSMYFLILLVRINIVIVNETFFTFDPLSNILNGCLIKFLSLSFPGKLTRCFTLCILRLRFDQFSPLCRNIISLWIFFWRFILYLAQLWTYFCNFYAIGLKYIIVKGQKLKE